MNKVLGYQTPADLRKNYAKFYWHGVYPYIQEALRYLTLTQQGKQIIANLHSNVLSWNMKFLKMKSYILLNNYVLRY